MICLWRRGPPPSPAAVGDGPRARRARRIGRGRPSGARTSQPRPGARPAGRRGPRSPISRDASSRLGAASRRAAIAGSSGPAGRLELGEPRVQDGADVADPCGQRAALVAAIPAPIATSPRASRVMSRQPPAVRAGSNGRPGRRIRSIRRPLPRGPRPGPAASGSCRRRRRSWVVAVIRTRLGPARPGEPFHGVDRGRRRVAPRHDDPWPADEQVAHRRRVPGRLAAGHRMTADESEAVRLGALHDRGLRARDIGDRHIRPERRRGAVPPVRPAIEGSPAAARPGRSARHPRSPRPAMRRRRRGRHRPERVAGHRRSATRRRAPTAGHRPRGGRERRTPRSVRTRGTRSTCPEYRSRARVGMAVDVMRRPLVSSGRSAAARSVGRSAVVRRRPAGRDRRADSGGDCGLVDRCHAVRCPAGAPQRGQRRSSANSDSSGETV